MFSSFLHLEVTLPPPLSEATEGKQQFPPVSRKVQDHETIIRCSLTPIPPTRKSGGTAAAPRPLSG